MGFSPCQGSRQGLKPRVIWPEVARLKPCPDTKPEALGQSPKVHFRQNVFRPEGSGVEGSAVQPAIHGNVFILSPCLTPLEIASNQPVK